MDLAPEFVVRALCPSDAWLLAHAAAGVFDNPVNSLLAAEFLNDPRHHLVVAIDAGQVIGFVSALHYVHPDKAAELWLNEVSVAPTHQNRGIGRQMLQNMLGLGRELGCGCAWVLTDRANAPAMRLYAAAGGVEAPTPSIMSNSRLKVPSLSTPMMPPNPSLNTDVPCAGLLPRNGPPVSLFH
jgi:ribosomal protein S18 acetylase RimI-like enzyme